MSKIQWKKEILAIVLIMLQFIVVAVLLKGLPSTVPLHWNIEGNIDRYGEKFFLFMLPAISLILYTILLFLPLLDPKKFALNIPPEPIFRIIRYSLIILHWVLLAVILGITTGRKIPAPQIIFGSVSLFLVIVGNFMGKVRQNRFVGFRLPWTLNNEVVWNKTNRFAGKCLVAGGLISFCLILVLPIKEAGYAFISLIAVASLIPIVYSLVIYKKETQLLK